MNVLITGAATGFGRLTAELLSASGHRILATLRDAAGRNASAAAALGQLPGVTVLEMDVTSDVSVTEAVRRAEAEAGHLDCVLNNAGFAGFGVTEDFPISHWQAVLNTNLLGCVRVNNAVLPSMRKRRSGLLIHITSVAGRVAVPYLVPYASSKWALECYAESLRLELAPFGVDSVVVEPGKYRTEIFGKADNAIPPGSLDPSDDVSPGLCGRFLQWFMTDMETLAQDPREVAAAVQALLDMPFGRRPFRTPVGADAVWVKPYNDVADEIRMGVATRMGLPELVQEVSGKAADPGDRKTAATQD